MTSMNNPYDSLYANLKTSFSYVENGHECTLGEVMLIKAGEREASKSSLALTTVGSANRSITAIISYVNDKLSIKDAPEKSKTIRTFPFRTSMSAMFSAVAACALVFSLGIFALTGNALPGLLSADSEVSTEDAASETLDEQIYKAD